MLTPRLAQAGISVVYLALGVGWLVIDSRPELMLWGREVRPWVWLAAGAVGLLSLRWWSLARPAMAGMLFLAAERVITLLIGQVSGVGPHLWFSAVWYVPLCMAAVAPHLIPGRRAG